MKHGKNYNESLKAFDRDKRYTPSEAIEIVKKTAKTKYDSQIRVSYKLNVDPRHADQLIRGAIVLPSGTGKTQKVLVVAQGAKAEEAKNAGADIVGDKDVLEKIAKGWTDFDVIVATPDMMGELGKLGKVLGPKGLMPNPKTGTVTMNVAGAIEEIKKGKATYRVDKDGNINCAIGLASFTNDQLQANFDAINNAIIKAKPATVKGNYITNLVISSNMGPGVRVIF